MKLSNLIAPKNPPPTPEQRKRNIELVRWWWFEQNGYEPHLSQMDFHLALQRFRMIIAGTRGGKSRAAGEEAVPYLLAGATRVWIVGQTYALTEKEFRYVHERMTSRQAVAFFNGRSPIAHVTNNDKGGDMRIKTKWGSEVKCISLEKADLSALGEEVDLLIMSEGAVIKRPKYIWERYLRGRLATRLGDLIIPTTPAGRASKHDADGWMHSMYLKGLDPDEPDYYTREWPSWENPTFRENPYELQRTLDPLIFAEQYLGQFVTFAGAVYRDFNPDVHVISPFNIPTHWRRYEAIDPGHASKFFHLSAVSGEMDTIYIVGEAFGTELLYKEQAQEIQRSRCKQYRIPNGLWDRFQRKHNIQTMTYIDPEDSQARDELSNEYGIPCVKANNSVYYGIDKVARRLKYDPTHAPTLYITTDCPETLEAITKHGWGERRGNRGGTVTRKPADDPWKHSMDTLRYICTGHIVPSDPVPDPVPEGETMWELMEEMRLAETVHPFEMTMQERRRL